MTAKQVDQDWDEAMVGEDEGQQASRSSRGLTGLQYSNMRLRVHDRGKDSSVQYS